MAWNGICGRERGGKVRGVSDGKKLAHSLTRKRQRWPPVWGVNDKVFDALFDAKTSELAAAAWRPQAARGRRE